MSELSAHPHTPAEIGTRNVDEAIDHADIRVGNRQFVNAIAADTAVVVVLGEQQVGGGPGVRRHKVRRNH